MDPDSSMSEAFDWLVKKEEEQEVAGLGPRPDDNKDGVIVLDDTPPPASARAPSNDSSVVEIPNPALASAARAEEGEGRDPWRRDPACRVSPATAGLINCASCGRQGHGLGVCVNFGPLGFLQGCPICNTRVHSVDTHFAEGLTKGELFRRFVEDRAGKAPLRSRLFDWAAIARDFSPPPAYPWTRSFAKATRGRKNSKEWAEHQKLVMEYDYSTQLPKPPVDPLTSSSSLAEMDALPREERMRVETEVEEAVLLAAAVKEEANWSPIDTGSAVGVVREAEGSPEGRPPPKRLRILSPVRAASPILPSSAARETFSPGRGAVEESVDGEGINLDFEVRPRLDEDSDDDLDDVDPLQGDDADIMESPSQENAANEVAPVLLHQADSVLASVERDPVDIHTFSAQTPSVYFSARSDSKGSVHAATQTADNNEGGLIDAAFVVASPLSQTQFGEIKVVIARLEASFTAKQDKVADDIKEALHQLQQRVDRLDRSQTTTATNINLGLADMSKRITVEKDAATTAILDKLDSNQKMLSIATNSGFSQLAQNFDKIHCSAKAQILDQLQSTEDALCEKADQGKGAILDKFNDTGDAHKQSTQNPHACLDEAVNVLGESQLASKTAILNKLHDTAEDINRSTDESSQEQLDIMSLKQATHMTAVVGKLHEMDERLQKQDEAKADILKKLNELSSSVNQLVAPPAAPIPTTAPPMAMPISRCHSEPSASSSNNDANPDASRSHNQSKTASTTTASATSSSNSDTFSSKHRQQLQLSTKLHEMGSQYSAIIDEATESQRSVNGMHRRLEIAEARALEEVARRALMGLEGDMERMRTQRSSALFEKLEGMRDEKREELRKCRERLEGLMGVAFPQEDQDHEQDEE